MRNQASGTSKQDFQAIFDFDDSPASRHFLAGNDGNGLRVSLKDLGEFLANPLRSHCRTRLGIRLDPEDDNASQNQEALDPPAWLASNLLRAAILKNPEIDTTTLIEGEIRQLLDQDRLFPGPFSQRLQRQVASGVLIASQELSELTDQQAVQTTPDLDFPLLVSGVKLRITGQLRELLVTPSGKRYWLITSQSDIPSAGKIPVDKLTRLAVGLAALQQCGLSPPSTLIHASCRPGVKKPVFSLEIQDLGDYQLGLEDLVAAWVHNLQQPLPFYGDWLKTLGKNFNQATAASQLDNYEQVDPASAWDEWWETLSDPYDNGADWATANHPWLCPYFNFLSRSTLVHPAWKAEYQVWLDRVWLPVLRRQRSFISKRGKN